MKKKVVSSKNVYSRIINVLIMQLYYGMVGKILFSQKNNI